MTYALIWIVPEVGDLLIQACHTGRGATIQCRKVAKVFTPGREAGHGSTTGAIDSARLDRIGWMELLAGKMLPFSDEVFSEERDWTEAKQDLKKLYITSAVSRI